MNFLQNLQSREKILILVASIGIVAYFLFSLLIDPMLQRSRDLERQMLAARRQLSDLQTLQGEYQRQKSIIDSINGQLKRQQNFAIFSRLEELAGQTGIRSKILHMKPTVNTPSEAYNEESVEVKMEGVTLEQLVRYLQRVENSPQLMKIKRLDVKPRLENRQILTATFRVSSFTLKEGNS